VPLKQASQIEIVPNKKKVRAEKPLKTVNVKAIWIAQLIFQKYFVVQEDDDDDDDSTYV